MTEAQKHTLASGDFDRPDPNDVLLKNGFQIVESSAAQNIFYNPETGVRVIQKFDREGHWQTTYHYPPKKS